MHLDGFGGIGSRHLYCEQGILKVKRLLAHLRSKSSLGKVLNIIIDWYQQLSGLPEPILLNTSYIPGTRNQWLTSLRIFLHETNCTIRLENEWSHPIICEHDRNIMSLLLADDLPNATIANLNTVRQYLQITTIAELFDNSGLHFHAGAFGKLTSDNQLVIRQFHSPRTSWPNIPRPTTSSLQLWRNTITRLCKNLPLWENGYTQIATNISFGNTDTSSPPYPPIKLEFITTTHGYLRPFLTPIDEQLPFHAFYCRL